MQAVIRTGSKQYLVRPDQTLEIDLVPEGTKTLEFEALLVIDGDKTQVGTPVVDGVTVTAKVLEMVKGDKIKVLKYKAKKREKTLTGHRQKYTRIQIIGIGSAKATKTPAAKATARKTPTKATA